MASLLIASFIAAFASAGVGVGLGLVLTPVIMHAGVNPVLACNTEMYMAFYATLASTIVVMVFGGLNYSYALNLIILSLIGSPIGSNLGMYMVKKYGRMSIIVILLTLCILFCVVLIPVISYPKIIEQHHKGVDFIET